MSKRVMFYSHDTFGLGHIRRTQKIANSIAGEDKSILIACSSPLANSFLSGPGIEYLNLPGFAKQANGEYLPRSLQIPIEEFISLRASLLLAAVRNFQPQILVVDKEPLGVKGELLPSLRYIRSSGMSTRVVCGFRDILDEKEKVAQEWDRKGVLKGLSDFYDNLLVYGEKENLDFCTEYSIPEKLADRVIYTGYVQPKETLEKEFFALDFPKDRPVVTFTLGGGGDGWNYIDTFLDVVENGNLGADYNFVLLTGPFSSQPMLEKAKKVQQKLENLRVIEFTNNTPGLFERSALVISMGGYNTICELLHLKKFPLILPRVTPRQEQLIRARVMRAKGYCDFIHPSELDAKTLAKKIREMVAYDRTNVPPFATDGIGNVGSFIEETLEQCQQKAPSSGLYSRVIPA
jgi:predicted glycosyltransferase